MRECVCVCVCVCWRVAWLATITILCTFLTDKNSISGGEHLPICVRVNIHFFFFRYFSIEWNVTIFDRATTNAAHRYIYAAPVFFFSYGFFHLICDRENNYKFAFLARDEIIFFFLQFNFRCCFFRNAQNTHIAIWFIIGRCEAPQSLRRRLPWWWSS